MMSIVTKLLRLSCWLIVSSLRLALQWKVSKTMLYRFALVALTLTPLAALPLTETKLSTQSGRNTLMSELVHKAKRLGATYEQVVDACGLNPLCLEVAALVYEKKEVVYE